MGSEEFQTNLRGTLQATGAWKGLKAVLIPTLWLEVNPPPPVRALLSGDPTAKGEYS